MTGKSKRTDFFWPRENGPVVISGFGAYKPEYIRMAIQRDNFPFSSLQQEALPTHVDTSTGHRTMDGITYIQTLPMSRVDAEHEAEEIRRLGGLARVLKSWGNRFTVWFNPNGSKPALDYVSGW